MAARYRFQVAEVSMLKHAHSPTIRLVIWAAPFVWEHSVAPRVAISIWSGAELLSTVPMKVAEYSQLIGSAHPVARFPETRQPPDAAAAFWLSASTIHPDQQTMLALGFSIRRYRETLPQQSAAECSLRILVPDSSTSAPRIAP